MKDVATALKTGNVAGIPLPAAASGDSSTVKDIALSGDKAAVAGSAPALSTAIETAVVAAANTTSVTSVSQDTVVGGGGGATSGGISAGLATSAVALALFSVM